MKFISKQVELQFEKKKIARYYVFINIMVYYYYGAGCLKIVPIFILLLDSYSKVWFLKFSYSFKMCFSYFYFIIVCLLVSTSNVTNFCSFLCYRK